MCIDCCLRVSVEYFTIRQSYRSSSFKYSSQMFTTMLRRHGERGGAASPLHLDQGAVVSGRGTSTGFLLSLVGLRGLSLPRLEG